MSFGLRFGTLGAGSRKSSAASPPAAPTLTLTSGPSVNTPTFVLTGDLLLGDTERFQYATAADFSGASEITNTITAPEDAANELDFATGALADGAWWFRSRTERPGAGNSAWSDTQSETIATVTATTLNPSDTAPGATLSNGNLTLTGSGGYLGSRTVASASNGNKYWEVRADAITASPSQIVEGMASTTQSLTLFCGDTLQSIGWARDGNIYVGGGSVAVIQGWAQGDTLSFVARLDDQTMFFRTNGGNWNNSGTANPATNTGGIHFSTTGNGPFFAFVQAQAIDKLTANFGGSPYAQSVPAGCGNW